MSLYLDGSGSCCVLDSNINLYIYFDDKRQVLYHYDMDVCRYRNYGRNMYVEEVESVQILNIISVDETAYLL